MVPNHSQFHLSERQVEGKLRGSLVAVCSHNQVNSGRDEGIFSGVFRNPMCRS